MKVLIQISIIILIPICLFAQRSTEKLRMERPDGFYFQSDLSLTYKEGNSNYTNIKTNGRLDYDKGRYFGFIFVEQEYKKSPSELITANGFIHFRNTYEFTGKVSGEFFIQDEFDRLSYLDYRTLAGGGARFDLIDGVYNHDSTMRTTLYYGLGAMYEIENYTIGNGILNNKWRATTYLSFKWNYNNTEFTCVGYYQPFFEDISDFRLLLDTRLSFKVFDNLSFFTNLVYKYNNIPPPTVVHYDVNLNSGITINFSI